MRTPEEIWQNTDGFDGEATLAALRTMQRETIEACAVEARKHYWIKDAVAAIRALLKGGSDDE